MLKPSGGMLKKVFGAPTAFTGAKKKPSFGGSLPSSSAFGRSKAPTDSGGSVGKATSGPIETTKKKGIFGKAISSAAKSAAK